jgi:hypothetical protein
LLFRGGRRRWRLLFLSAGDKKRDQETADDSGKKKSTHSNSNAATLRAETKSIADAGVSLQCTRHPAIPMTLKMLSYYRY